MHAGKPFIVIERNNAIVDSLHAANIPALQGDAEEEEMLEAAGIREAKGLIITLPEDSENVFTTLVAREINPEVFILARTSDIKNRKKLLRAGAHKVIAPTDVGADRMAQVILRPNVDEFMEQVLKTSALGLQVDEVIVQPKAPLAGKTLAESHFRQRFDAIVIAVIDGVTKEMKFNPAPNAPINTGDILIVLGNEEMINQLRQFGCTTLSS